MLGAKYPEGDIIRLILDNHSAHTSKETHQFLAALPEDRFVFVFTPTHTSWLNMIESFFSKMTKQMLKGIRVNLKEELSEWIYHYFDEINADPIVYHWTYKMDEIDPDEAATCIRAVEIYSRRMGRACRQKGLWILVWKSGEIIAIFAVANFKRVVGTWTKRWKEL